MGRRTLDVEDGDWKVSRELVEPVAVVPPGNCPDKESYLLEEEVDE